MISNFEDLHAKTKGTEETGKKIGLKINAAKSKTLRNNSNDRRKVKVGGSEIEEVSKFTYLGSAMDRNGGSDADLDTRIVKSQIAFKNLSKIWTSKKIAKKTKLKIFNHNVKSVLFYGSESWKLNKNFEPSTTSVYAGFVGSSGLRSSQTKNY